MAFFVFSYEIVLQAYSLNKPQKFCTCHGMAMQVLLTLQCWSLPNKFLLLNPPPTKKESIPEEPLDPLFSFKSSTPKVSAENPPRVSDLVPPTTSKQRKMCIKHVAVKENSPLPSIDVGRRMRSQMGKGKVPPTEKKRKSSSSAPSPSKKKKKSVAASSSKKSQSQWLILCQNQS